MSVEEAQMKNRTFEQIIEARRIIGGPSDLIKSSSKGKYSWAYPLFQQMQGNDWRPSTVPVSKDINCFKRLTDGERLAHQRALAFLTGLDGLQVENISNNIVEHITDYGVAQCLYRQIYEEALHVDSYALMIETFYKNPLEIYSLHETDELLVRKNATILAQAQAVDRSQDYIEKMYYALISNIILEGVYFNSGFLFFYVLSKTLHKMHASSENVSYIHRDENTHTLLFLNIATELWRENREILDRQEVRDNVANLFAASVKMEQAWGAHIVEGGVAGMTPTKVGHHIESLADFYLSRIPGQQAIFHNKSPYPWVANIVQDPNAQEKNFFENTPTAYTKRGLDFDGDDF